MNKIRLLSITLALIQPLAIIYFFGIGFKSFSKCYNTTLEPIFILSNVLVAYLFVQHERWKFPALFLVLLTCFSTDSFSNLHNIFASCFFLSCLYPLAEFKRLRFYFAAYCCSLVVAGLFGLFWFETWCNYVLCAYHLHLWKIGYDYENRHKIW